MARNRFSLTGFPTIRIQQALVVALALLFANVVKPVSGDVVGLGTVGLGTVSNGCTLTLGDESTYVGNDINNIEGVTFSTAGTLTCEAVVPPKSGPCQRATISNCQSVVCNSNACQNADLSMDVDAVQCVDGSACTGATLPSLCAVTYTDGSTSIGAAIQESAAHEYMYHASTDSLTCHDCDGLVISGCLSVVSTNGVCTLSQPGGNVYFGSDLATLAGVEFDAQTNTLICKLHTSVSDAPCKATISGCSQLICEQGGCWGAAIASVPSIECNGASACREATMTDLLNDAIVKCLGLVACLGSEITTADSSSGTRVICDGANACGTNQASTTTFDVDCLDCRFGACQDNCLFHGEDCQTGPQGSCPCSLVTSAGETYLEEDINTLTDVSYNAKTNSILCEGELNGLCRGGRIMGCPTVECSTRACKGTTIWKPNALDCVGQWACREARLKELPSGATASCNGDRACVDAKFTSEEGQGGVTVDCIDAASRACLRATLDDSAL